MGGAVVAATGLTGCYAHHTADEEALEPSAYSTDDEDDDQGLGSDTASADAGAAEDPCGDVPDTDVLGQIYCDFTTGGANGSLGTPSGNQCDDVSPDDFATLALCAAGGGSTGQTGGLDLSSLLSLADLLAGGGQSSGAGGGLGDLLGLLGGGNTTGSTGSTGGLGDLLGLLGGGNTTGSTGTGGLGDLLGLLGGLGGNAGATGNSANTGTTGNGLADLLGLLGGLGGGTGGAANNNSGSGTR